MLASSVGCGALSRSTEVAGIQVHATFHHVGVQVDFVGDFNDNATATLEASIGGGDFEPVHRMSRVYNNRFVGTVFNLDPETSVEVRVKVSDADGVSNETQQASITTRSTATPKSTGRELHVDLAGNDTSGDGSMGSPFATIQHAIDLASAGDTVLLHAGTYHEAVSMDSGPSGSEDAPLTIRSAGDGLVMLDGSSPSLGDPSAWKDEGGSIYSADVDDTYYIGIDGRRLWRYDEFEDLETLAYNTDGGFYVDTSARRVYLRLPGDSAPAGHEIQVSTLASAFEMTSTTDVVLEGLVFRNFNHGPHSSAISVIDKCTRIWVENNVFEQMETGVRLEGRADDTVVINNEFSDLGINDFDWELVKEYQWWLEHGALYVSNDEYSGHGTIFYKNFVHDYFDGVKIVGTEELEYASNSDVVDNRFFHLSDDGVETDGYSSNVRITGNRFENLLAGVSVAPAEGGPVYIVRNLMVDLNNVAFTDYETTAIKFNYDGEISGEIFAYHNTAVTFEAENAGLSVSNHSNWTGLTLANNIWQGTLNGMYYYLNNELPVDQDYDLLFAASSDDSLFLYQGEDYATVDAYFEVSGRCANCLSGSPAFVDGPGGDYQLQASSPAIDRAIKIPGINDRSYSGDAPDIGALEFSP